MALVVTLALPLGGCTDDSRHELPSIGGETKPPIDDIDSRARAFYNCLRDADLPAELYESEGDYPTNVGWDEDAVVMWMTPGGSGGAQGDVDQDEIEDFFKGGDYESYRLIVNGADQSTVFADCHESTGYDESDAWGNGSPGSVDLAYYQAVVEASNDWAACARENGWPQTLDADMPVSADGSEYPTAVLPSSITEDQLRQLLEACPNFDAEAMEHNDELMQDFDGSGGFPDGYWTAPSVGFDYPGFDGQPFDFGSTGEPNAAELATQERLSRLQEILWEEQNAYYESEYGSGGAIALPR
jgi:hypothetical protein